MRKKEEEDSVKKFFNELTHGISKENRTSY